MANKINFNAIRKLVKQPVYNTDWKLLSSKASAELHAVIKKASKEKLAEFALKGRYCEVYTFFGVKSPSERSTEQHNKASEQYDAVIKKIDELELKYAIGDTTDADLKALLVTIQSLNKN